MKKTLFTFLVVAVATLAAPRPTSAQSAPALVKIPFQFIAGGTVLPAGSYWISPDTHDPSVMLLANVNGKPAAVFAVFAATAVNPTLLDPQVRVAFKNVDGQHFLWQVTMPGDDAREVIVTRAQAQRTLAKLNLIPAQHADVAK